MAAIIINSVNQTPTVGEIHETFIIDTNDVATAIFSPKQIKSISNVVATAQNANAAAQATTLITVWAESSTLPPTITFNPGAVGCQYRVTVIGLA